jgi:AcrR family transcriptional regulator
MGSPGVPARLRKIAALTERGSAGQAPTPGAASQPAEPQVETEIAETEIAETEIAEAGLAEAEPEVTGHVAVDMPPVKPVVKALADKRRPARSMRPRRGRPRSERADRAILQAATELLADKGVSGLTIEEVALRAGVGKTTIYRRWSSRGTLALDAYLAEIDELRALPDTGTFSGDLRAALGAWVKAVAGTPAGVMLVGLIAEVHKDPGLAMAWQDQVIAPLRAHYSIMLDHAISRGEIPEETDAGVVLDIVFGACYYRLLHVHRPLNDQFVNQVIDIVTTGVGAGR